MEIVKVATVLVLVIAAITSTDGAVFGQGNVMYRRYPNGPNVYQRMPVPARRPFSPVSRTPVFRTRINQGTPAVVNTNQDNSWMFDNRGGAVTRVVGRPMYWRN